MSFTPRLEAPALEGWYAAENNGFARRADDLGMPNCTAYAASRASEILNREFEIWHGNAKTWWEQNVEAGWYTYGQEARIGAVVVFDATEDNDCGHVAVVEELVDDVITISASHYEKDKSLRNERFWDLRTFNYKNEFPHGNILGFIYIYKGDDNMTVDRADLYTRTTYIEVLGRDADPDGLQTYRNMIIDKDENDDLSCVDDSLRASDEYKRNFIFNAYRNLLNREPESEQVVSEKMGYARLRDITEDILNSEEYQNTH